MRREEIKKIFIDVGFEIVGITTPDFDLVRSNYEKSIELGYYSPLIKGNVGQRINPSLILEDVQSIIVLGLTYTKSSPIIDKTKPYFGNSSWGRDYHKVIKEKAEEGILKLKAIIDFNYEIVCDTSYLDDRFLAYSAGLGFFGKNSLLINKELGSYFFIGAILVDLELEVDSPGISLCGDCNKCLTACPNGAINKTNLLDSYKCRSFITQSKEGSVSNIGNSVFGCDICASVCPFNKDINHTKNIEFMPSGIEQITAEIEMSNKKFKEVYGHLAGSYIGKKRINRNIKTVKENKNMV